MKKLFAWGVLCFAILFSTKVFGQEAYAVFDEESGTLTFKYDDKKPEGAYGMRTIGRWSDNWTSIYSRIKKVIFHSSFADYQPTNCAHWFFECSNLTEIVGMKEYLNTGNVTDMSYMFSYCRSLTSLDFSSFNTENVTDMSYMFSDCRSLTSLDLSSFNTEKVTNMGYMFSWCSSLTSLDLSDFKTENVTSMYDMFSRCRSLTSLDLSCFNTEKVTGMSYMFYDCSNLTSLDLSGFNTKNVTDMGNMFSYCNCLKTIYVNVNWNTTSVVYSDDMFYDCNKLYGGKGSSYYDYDFDDKTYAKIDEGENNPGYFTKLGEKPFEIETESDAYAVLANDVLTFYCDKNKPDDALTIEEVGSRWSNWKSKVSIVIFDESFKKFTPTNCKYWFSNCAKLSEIVGMKENLKTENVKCMREMFNGCNELTNMDLSGFNTGKVVNMSYMFSNCNSLTSLDLSGFNTDKVRNMILMFEGCSNLKNLDLSSFDTENTKDMSGMFSGCSNIATIYISDKWTTNNTIDTCGMFYNCKNLIGEKGTKCNGNRHWYNEDLQFAKIDGGEDNPGYFTRREEISSISVSQKPESIIYQGSTWSTTGGEITIIYNSGTKKLIPFNTDGVEITDFNSKTQTFTIEYSGKKVAFSLNEEPAEEKKVEKIVISKPPKTIYYVGEEFDVSGGELSVFYSDNTTETVSLSLAAISSMDNKTAGIQTLTVKYQGKEILLDVNVKAVEVEKIALTTAPEKIEYLEGETFKADGGVLTVYYNNGETKTIDLDDNSVKISGFDNATPGKQTLKIEYIDKETELKVLVKAKSAVSISLTTSPAKTEYSKGETLDLSDGEITVKYDNGDEEIIGLSAAKVSGYDRNTPGKQILTAQYLGLSTTFEVEVKQPEIIEKPEQPDVETSTGDLAVKRSVKIWSFEKIVFVENAETSIYVVDLSGHVIKTVKPKNTRTEIRIDQTGVYIIKTGLKTKKVVIQ
jgi:surface protein